jgi:hypothetical protein
MSIVFVRRRLEPNLAWHAADWILGREPFDPGFHGAAGVFGDVVGAGRCYFISSSAGCRFTFFLLLLLS